MSYCILSCFVDVPLSIIILAAWLIDFTSKEAMENEGWVFDWNDQYVFAPGGNYCVDVPSRSYCGFRSPGQGTISYTFQSGENGVATLLYGQSWDKNSVSVSKNDVVIISRDTRGDSKITFDYSTGDILRITEIGESVINIHGLFKNLNGTYDLHFKLNSLFINKIRGYILPLLLV